MSTESSNDDFEAIGRETPSAYHEIQIARRRIKPFVVAIAATTIIVALAVWILEANGIRVWPRDEDGENWQGMRYDASTLYYSENVTEAEAKRLGDFLKRIGLFQFRVDGGITVYFNRRAETFVVSFFVSKGAWDNENVIVQMEDWRMRISQELFANQRVIIELCDSEAGGFHRLKVKRTVE